MGTYTITTTQEQDLAIEAEARRSGNKAVDEYVQETVNARLTDLKEQVTKELKAKGRELLEASDDAKLHEVMAILEKSSADPAPPKKGTP